MHMRQTNILYPTPIIQANYGYSAGASQIVYKEHTFKVYYRFPLRCTPVLLGITEDSFLCAQSGFFQSGTKVLFGKEEE